MSKIYVSMYDDSVQKQPIKEEKLILHIKNRAFAIIVLLAGTLLILSCSEKPPVATIEIKIIADPEFISGTYDFGSSSIESPYINIYSIEADSIYFEASTTADWITLIPKSGYTPDSIFVKISPAFLGDGQHVDTIFITAEGIANSPVKVVVEINIVIAFSISPQKIIYFVTEGNNINDTSLIIQSGGGTNFSYDISENSDWISISDSAGVTPDTLTISFDGIQSLVTGKYVDTLFLSSTEISGIDALVIELNINSWSLQDMGGGSSDDIQGVSFANDSLGWGVVFKGSGNLAENIGSIIKTSNAGNSWEETHQFFEVGADRGLKDIIMMSTTTGWVVGESNTILKTINGGGSWNSQEDNLNSLLDFNSVHFVDLLTGWICGVNGTVIRTVNGGSVWVKADNFTSKLLQDIYFSDHTNGWVIGNSGAAYRSANGGSQWSQMILPENLTATDLRSVYFTDNEYGWIVGEAGVVLHSTDGGANWSRQETEFSFSFSDVQFVDRLNGWIVGEQGTVLVTSDGGESWQKQDVLGVTVWLKDIELVGSSNIWIVGDDGTILAGQFVK